MAKWAKTGLNAISNSVDSVASSMHSCRMKKSMIMIVAAVLALVFRGYGQEAVLDQYQAQYRNGLEGVETVFREKRLAMPAAQVQALRQLEAQYQRAGDLQGMLAVQQERKRFVLDPRGSSIPVLQAPAELARLLASYKSRFAEIAVERDRSRADLKQRYVDALKKLQVTLTQQGNIQDAKRVMETIESLGSASPVPAFQASPAAAPAVAAPTPAPSSGGDAPAASGDDSFAEWFN
jgi:hypothetical protein